MSFSESEIRIMQHTLGISDIRYYETEKIENIYRNYYMCGMSGENRKIILSLVEKGMMESMGEKWGGEYFCVTDQGIELAKSAALSKALASKPNRSKRRYECYLHSECDEPFGEWLKNHYWDDYRRSYGA